MRIFAHFWNFDDFFDILGGKGAKKWPFLALFGHFHEIDDIFKPHFGLLEQKQAVHDAIMGLLSRIVAKILP